MSTYWFSPKLGITKSTDPVGFNARNLNIINPQTQPNQQKQLDFDPKNDCMRSCSFLFSEEKKKAKEEVLTSSDPEYLPHVSIF
jgi:hypothetical protein